LLKWIERGDIKKASFGFYIDAEEADFTEKKPHFKIKKVSLFDVSPVTYPAYSGTNVDLKRSAPQLEQEVSERKNNQNHAGLDESLRFLQEYRQRRIKELLLSSVKVARRIPQHTSKCRILKSVKRSRLKANQERSS
jgi:hypothetical protein